MSTAFPIFSSLEICEESCTTSLSHCLLAGHSDFYVCKLNISLFAGIIVLAVGTGVIIPLSILYCYLMECRPFCSRAGPASDEERQGLHSYNVQVSISGSDDGSLMPSVVRRETSQLSKQSNPSTREVKSVA
ncbi:unnamed protein product [Auanema sp. JU1783]|nr:unnamed protein product [Auanema sp. JU1783]